MVVKRLWIAFFLVSVAFAAESPLLPGTKIVAGDPNKNEFFIVGNNEMPLEEKPVVKEAPIFVANADKQVETKPKKVAPKEENNFVLRAAPQIKMAFNNNTAGKPKAVKSLDKPKQIIVASKDNKSKALSKNTAQKHLNGLTEKTASQIKMAFNNNTAGKSKAIKSLDKPKQIMVANKDNKSKTLSKNTAQKHLNGLTEKTASQIKVAFNKQSTKTVKSIKLDKSLAHFASNVKNVKVKSKKTMTSRKNNPALNSLPEMRMAFNNALHEKANQKLFDQVRVALKKSTTNKKTLVAKKNSGTVLSIKSNSNLKLAAQSKKSKKPVKLYISYKSIYLKKSVHKTANVKPATKVRIAQKKTKQKAKRVIT